MNFELRPYFFLHLFNIFSKLLFYINLFSNFFFYEKTVHTFPSNIKYNYSCNNLVAIAAAYP